MANAYQIIVCGSLVPDPLQTLEPISNPGGPALKNELMLPAALDPWAGHALFEAANLAKQIPGSQVWLVSLGPKAKLQQLMMSVAQKAAFAFVPVEGNAGGFMSSVDCASALVKAIQGITGLDMGRVLLFGGWESASRGAGSTLQLVGDALGINDQFMGVDEIKVRDDGSFTVLERVEGACHQESLCAGAPAVLGWATGNLPEPTNNPQVGMMNMRSIMPALQKAVKAEVGLDGVEYVSVSLPKQLRDTRIVKDMPTDEIAREIVEWIKKVNGGGRMEKILLLGFADQASSKLLAEGATVAANLAASLGCSWEVALIGEKVQEAANTLGGSGAAKFYGVEGEDFAFARYSSDLPAAEALLKESQATVILVPGSSRGNRVLSALAMRLGGRADTHITSVTAKEGKVLANRWFYRQRMEACFSRPQRPWVMGLEPGNVAPQTFSASSVQVQMLSVALPDAAKRTKVLGLKYPSGTAQTIRPDAKLLFVAGAGWTKKQADGQIHAAEAEKAILDFLSKAQASLGSTKSLVDQSGEGNAVLSFMTHLNQVGQTGSTPRHSKGLATCCHGEEPHVVGWRFVTERRAVNTDANCGWARGKTDVLYVADAFEVMKKVNEILSV